MKNETKCPGEFIPNAESCERCGVHRNEHEIPLTAAQIHAAAQLVVDKHGEAKSRRIIEALSELAGMGSDFCALLAAVQGGATLVITGPDPLGRNDVPRFGASLESTSGAIEAHAMGSELPRLLSDLAKSWASARKGVRT